MVQFTPSQYVNENQGVRESAILMIDSVRSPLGKLEEVETRDCLHIPIPEVLGR